MIQNCIKSTYMTKTYLPRPLIERSGKSVFLFWYQKCVGVKKKLLSPLINDEIDTVYLPFMAIWVFKL